ncbi:MAG: class I SAM-dependent methyltransferase [Kangiellaceae bacterium]
MQTHWNTFWQSGEISSIPLSTDNEYSSIIANYWLEFFKAQKARSKILDTATGNLIVPVFAMISNSNENKGFEVVATDLAEISPSAAMIRNPHLTEYIKQVESFGNVNNEDLPFANNSFDIITSMYGFEYSNLTKSINEFSRVLKVNGKIKLLCHCYDSSIVWKNNLTYKCINDIFDCQLFDLLKDLSISIGAIDSPKAFENMKANSVTESKRKKFNKQVEAVQLEHKEALLSTRLLHFIQEFISNLPNSTHDLRYSKIEDFMTGLHNTKQRLAELFRAALSQQEFEKLVETAKKLGLTLTNSRRIIDSSGNVLGLGIEFKK